MKKFFFNFLINILSKTLIFIDKIIKVFFKKNEFLPYIHDNIEKNQYYSVDILNNKYQFFCPSLKSLGRTQSILKREPETIDWINNFKKHNKKNIIFWDIGANIGLFSIYGAIKHKDIEIIAFEPSTSNTRVLSRNISINNFQEKIKIFQLALSDKENSIAYLNESKFIEGGSNSSYELNIRQNYLNENEIKNKYKFLGTNINNLFKEFDIKVPNYIKIDVDGIEDLILKGSTDILSKNELKELSVELNLTDKVKLNYIDKLLKSYGFEKYVSLNRRLFNDKSYIVKENENLNTVYKRL